MERTNDYLHARGRYNTMMDWERDDLVTNMGNNLNQCERAVQERMLWHFFMIHDDYGSRVGELIGLTADDVKHLEPLPKQKLTDDERKRPENLGGNGDEIDPSQWGQRTSSVLNHQVTAEDALSGNLRALPRGEDEAQNG